MNMLCLFTVNECVRCVFNVTCLVNVLGVCLKCMIVPFVFNVQYLLKYMNVMYVFNVICVFNVQYFFKLYECVVCV